MIDTDFFIISMFIFALCAFWYVMGVTSKPSRLKTQQDRNWEYLRGLLDMQHRFSGCVRRDGRSGRYLGRRG